MGNALGGGSGWVVLTYVPRDKRLVNQYAADHTMSIPGGVPIIALDMYEHAYHIDFGANVKAYVGTFMRNLDWKAASERYADALLAASPSSARSRSSRISRRFPSRSEGDDRLGRTSRSSMPAGILRSAPGRGHEGVTWRDPDHVQEDQDLRSPTRSWSIASMVSRRLSCGGVLRDAARCALHGRRPFARRRSEQDAPHGVAPPSTPPAGVTPATLTGDDLLRLAHREVAARPWPPRPAVAGTRDGYRIWLSEIMLQQTWLRP
jgi:hypothetical protein